MTDFDDLDDALEARAEERGLVVTAPAFIEDMDRLLPLVDALVAGFAAGRVILERPAERRALATLHARLDAVIGRLAGARGMIEHVFLQALTDRGAAAIPLGDGTEVRYEAPRGDYTGDMAALRAELMAIAELDGSVPREAVEDAFRETRTVVADHRKVNALAKKYGERVAETIAARRTYVTPPPERGRVRFPR